MRIYTRKGDDGTTGLLVGKRVPKHHPRIRAVGEADELSSALGAASAFLPSQPDFGALKRTICRIQGDLLELGASIASKGKKPFPKGSHDWLETEIDRLEARLKPLARFILPGGSEAGALLHLARGICRRAERSASAGGRVPGVIPYLNRLADFLFVAARHVNARLKKPEPRWRGRG